MKASVRPLLGLAVLSLLVAGPARAQTLLNVDFGVGKASAKVGFAATGQATNDFWNLYRHYDPKFVPGMPLVADGRLDNLKLADGADTKVSLAVSNAPGVWGNASGDPMYDTFIFAQNGSNITITVTGLEPGRYHFYLYGHADPDVTGEQNSLFSVRSGTNLFGPLTQLGSTGWKASSAWQERYQFVVARDVPVLAGGPLVIEVAPGPNGVAVLNGLQIISRGTSPPRLLAAVPDKAPFTLTNLLFREAHFEGKVTDTEARFTVDLAVESLTTNEISAPLFEGDVAVVAPVIPDGLRIVSSARKYRLIATRPGTYRFKLDLVARITKAEPWNQITFTGPNASIASVNATASAPGIEMQLLSGTQLDPEQKATSRLAGFPGADRVLSMRWQSRAAEVTRKSLVTVDTLAAAQITPTVIKFNTQFRYEILQAPLSKLRLALPADQTLTKLQGEQVRDWSVKPATAAEAAGQQVLTVEFLKPVEKAYTLTLLTESAVNPAAASTALLPPQPLDIERESGSFSLSADDMLVDIESTAGLRQVSAAGGTLAAYRFFGRPFNLTARLQRIEPVLKVADRLTARLEETRLLVAHALTLTVEKAGIYAVELAPQAGFVVADVKGEGVEDWKVTGGRLKVSFAARVLGARKLDVQLEQPHKTFPEQITLAPLRVTGATNETAQIGAAAALGIRLKTAGELSGLREIPGASLAGRSDELLAFAADQPDWRLTLAAERLPARVTAEVFNLVTIGDGLVGGSATIRYGILNQGVQDFKVRLPAHWKNIEFTGLNIRRKEAAPPAAEGTDRGPGVSPAPPAQPRPAGEGQVPGGTNYVTWTISLQDKAWGGYTLVVTYDYQFDPKAALLDLSGAHVDGVERETGFVALTAAASMELETKSAEPLRLIDQSELSDTDRALITRPVLRAYSYTGGDFKLGAALTRHRELDTLLNAVADRTQITSVLTEEGQMLTQASFMVKNNDKQFQRFHLPRGAKLWGCYVNNQPVKAEQDGDWLLVSLPRGANRDEAFAVDIKYEQKLPSLRDRLLPTRMALEAPRSDVPNTYAEWQVYLPLTQRPAGFSGNMTVARGTTYGLRDGWQRFLDFYAEFFRNHGVGVAVVGGGLLVLLLVVGGFGRRGLKGAGVVLGLLCIVGILGSMMLPALTKAKSKAQRISSVNHLQQIGLAAKMWAQDKGVNVLPASVEDLKEHLGSEKVLTDPQTGERLVYVGGGKPVDNPNAVVGYSPVDVNGRAVGFADGSARQVRSEEFARILELDRAITPQEPTVTTAGVAGKPQAADTRRRGGVVASRPGEKVELGVTAPAAPPPPAVATPAPAAGGMAGSGGGGFGGGLPAIQAVGGVNLGDWVDASGARVGGPVSGVAPTAAGIRSIKIDLPLSGRAYSFTKVLNVSDEPLTVGMSVEPLKAFEARRMVLQLLAFLVGLGVLWREWRRRPRRSLALAIGLALALGAVVHLMICQRTLHLVLIWGTPVLVAWGLGWLAWKHLLRRQQSPSPEPEPGTRNAEPGTSAAAPGAPPAVAGLLLAGLLAWGLGSPAAAGQSEVVRPKSDPDQPQSAILAATYTGTVREKVAQFDLTLRLTTFTTNQTVPLFGEDVALETVSLDATNAALLREGRVVSLHLPDRGPATLKARLVVKLGGDVTKRQLVFGIPPALSSRLSMTIDEGEADVEFPTAVSFDRKPGAKDTRVEAIIGAGDRVEMFWTPRMKRATEMAASVFAQNVTRVTVGGGVVNTRATLDYQITQGELRQAKVRLPAGQRLLRVEGDLIRVWELKDDGGSQGLTVDLVKPAAPAYKLTVETEKLLEKLPAQVAVAVPQALDVIRETGLVGLKGSEELSLTVESAADLQRVDAAEFAPAGLGDGLLSAYRFLKPGFELVARAEAVQPQIEAMVHNATWVGFERVTLTASVDYTIKKAGVFALRLALPEGYKVESVTGGSNVLQWIEKPNPRTLDVSLKERTLGAFSLRVTLSQAHKELPKTVAVAGVTPLDTSKLTGYVSVAAEAGVAVKTTTFDGLIEIPAAQLSARGPGISPAPAQQRQAGGAPSGGSVLAFKSVGTDPQTAAQWRLSVATETVESWVRAEVVNLFSVSETLVSGRAWVRYDIQNAPVKEFRVRVPAAFKNVEVFGPNIRRRDPGAEWRIELQNKVRGTYTLTFTWEQPRDARASAALEAPGLEAVGVERETGFVVLLARPPLQVTEKTASDQLLRIDPRELPEWAGVSATAGAPGGEVPVLVYRYLRPGYTLALEARRYEEAAVLQALVDSARLTTVVADDGQMMTEMTLQIRNNGLQHLAIELPTNTTVWSAFVAGQPVRPSQKSGRLLLPLERSRGDAPIGVELTYVAREKFPKTKGKVALLSPRLDVPLKNARWELYLPPDYDYRKFEGSMTHEAEAAPVIQVYSSTAYFQQEQAKKAERKADVSRAISNVKGQLAAGNFKAANEDYANTWFFEAGQDADTKKEVDQLRLELNRAQSSNLIQAQRAYSARSAGRYDASQPQGGAVAQQVEQAAQMLAYDEQVAGQQVDALQKAQQLTVTRLQPLRANLPTRGVRHSFSQVLQTEVNKPMTVQFIAANTRHVGWFARLLYLVAGFALLWIFAAVVVSRASREREAQPA